MSEKKSATPAFIASADWHICPSAWKGRPGLRGDSYYSLTQVVDLCIAYDVPLLAAGDLLDSSTPTPADVRCIRKEMIRMRKADLPVYYIQGQHEKVLSGGAGTATWLSGIADWPTHVHDQSFEIGDLVFHGLDWLPRGRLQEYLVLQDLDDVDFVLCHEPWLDLMGNRGNTDGKLDDIPGTCDVISGDLHQATQKTFAAGERTIYSPGALHRLDITEPPPSVILFGEDGCPISRIPLRCRGAITYQAGTEAELTDIVAVRITVFLGAMAALSLNSKELADCALHDESHDINVPIVRVEFSGDLKNALPRLIAACQPDGGTRLAHLFPKRLDRPATTDDDEQETATVASIRAQGLVGAVATGDMSDCPPDVNQAAVRHDLGLLLQSNNIPADLETICTDFLARAVEVHADASYH